MSYANRAHEVLNHINEYPLTGLFIEATEELLGLSRDLIRKQVETPGDKKLLGVFEQASGQFTRALRDWRENAYRTEVARAGMERLEAHFRFNSIIFTDLEAVIESLGDDHEKDDKKKKKAKNAIEKIKGLLPDKLPWPFDGFDISLIKKILDQILNIFLTVGVDAGAPLDTPLNKPSS